MMDRWDMLESPYHSIKQTVSIYALLVELNLFD